MTEVRKAAFITMKIKGYMNNSCQSANVLQNLLTKTNNSLDEVRIKLVPRSPVV